MDIYTEIYNLAKNAKDASRILARISSAAKNCFLHKLDELLGAKEKELLDANSADLAMALKSGLDAPRMDRLALTHEIIDEMRAGCRHVANLDDPVGATETQWQRPNGLLVGKMRIPLGVIAMIYEARPNVTIDSAILCIKAGNAVILRGGKQAINSNTALAAILQEALCFAGLPQNCAQLINIPGYETITELCQLDDLVDVVIPRGGEGLIRTVCEAATVPVLKHYKGVCHCYVDQGADLDQALNIVENAKTQRPGVCNALECLLVHKDEASLFLPKLAFRLAGVQFRADQKALPFLGANAIPVSIADKGFEFHAPVLVVLVVNNMDEALNYIAEFGSNHTEIICTQDYERSMRFLREVDASMVAVNASSRFNDGGQLGLGAEIGISTSKLHAYGPMGVKELTTTKFVVLGNGQIRS